MQFPVFETHVRKRGRTWWWFLCTADGRRLRHGSEAKRSTARYRANRALFEVLLFAAPLSESAPDRAGSAGGPAARPANSAACAASSPPNAASRLPLAKRWLEGQNSRDFTALLICRRELIFQWGSPMFDPARTALLRAVLDEVAKAFPGPRPTPVPTEPRKFWKP